MARSIDVDISRFVEALEDAVDTIADGAITGMHDVLDDWKREATDIAPIDKGTLRRSIQAGDVERSGGLNISGEITANAIEQSRRGRFNYAYYIHEADAGGKRLRVPGTEKKFLDVALERNETKWIADIEREIENELKRKGW